MNFFYSANKTITLQMKNSNKCLTIVNIMPIYNIGSISLIGNL